MEASGRVSWSGVLQRVGGAHTHLILGILEVEHDAAVFALIAIICNLEQVKHLLLNVEGNFSYFILCHD